MLSICLNACVILLITTVTMDASPYSTTPFKRIYLIDNKIPIPNCMEKFQNHIYKYIKHSHKSRWKDYEFKHFCEVFETTPILSVVEFSENYTFSPQAKLQSEPIPILSVVYFTKNYIFTSKIEIQSEYYHSDQVSISIHVLHTCSIHH